MKTLFKSKWTKWIPIGRFTFQETEFIVMGGRNIENGLLRFKTIRVNGRFFASGLVNPLLPHDVLDVQKQWDILTEETP